VISLWLPFGGVADPIFRRQPEFSVVDARSGEPCSREREYRFWMREPISIGPHGRPLADFNPRQS
jgi:hypothetical protein